MRIYLARHGQSLWQLSPSDDWDTGLSETGLKQARLLSRWLADRRCVVPGERTSIMKVYSSPLRRAQETADVIADGLRLSVKTLPSLAEASFHVSAHLPETMRPWEPRATSEPTAEYLDFKARAGAAWRELVGLADANPQPLLAVSHGGLIKTMLRVILGTDAASFKIFNAALQVLEWKNGRWYLIHLNLLDHLPVKLRT